MSIHCRLDIDGDFMYKKWSFKNFRDGIKKTRNMYLPLTLRLYIRNPTISQLGATKNQPAPYEKIPDSPNRRKPKTQNDGCIIHITYFSFTTNRDCKYIMLLYPICILFYSQFLNSDNTVMYVDVHDQRNFVCFMISAT